MNTLPTSVSFYSIEISEILKDLKLEALPLACPYLQFAHPVTLNRAFSCLTFSVLMIDLSLTDETSAVETSLPISPCLVTIHNPCENHRDYSALLPNYQETPKLCLPMAVPDFFNMIKL